MTRHMRIIAFVAVAACLVVPGRIEAQTPATPAAASELPDIRMANMVDFGGRGTAFGSGSDEARYQRYQDYRSGPTINFFRVGSQTGDHQYTVQASRVGYRDQQYSVAYNRYGKIKASFEWNQIPLFATQDAATLFSSSSPGVLLLPDSIQSGIQNRTITTADAVVLASPLDLRLKRSIADFRLTYSATRHLDFNLLFKNTLKKGSQLWEGTFGFNDAVELPAPVDTQTTELGAAAEWTNNQGLVRVGYDGSFFRNDVRTLVWDNPLRITDSPTAGPVQGRESFWPNSNLNAGNVSGLIKLPARSQATGYLSLGAWSQNDPLIPFTINSALPVLPLDRPTADARARVTSTAFSFNSRPTNLVWLNARFRSYDFDNRTPVFHLANTVVYDTSVAAFAEGGTSPYSFGRKTFDADASITPNRYTALRVGYTHEGIDQTFRTFDEMHENTIRVSADATGISWLTVRAVYEHAKRVGSGLDEQTLDDIGEHVSLRQFDISNRDSDRFSTIAMVMPVAALSFNGMVSAGRENRPEVVFGLRSNNNRAYSVGLDYVPSNTVSVGVSYEHEKFDTLQNSRQANPGAQFDDPTRDWTTSGNDSAKTLIASFDLLRALPKTDVRFAYDFSRAESTYVYTLAPNTTLAPVTQLPTVSNQFHRATLDVRHYLTGHVAAGFIYLFDQYRVNDYAFGSQTLTTRAQPAFLMLGSLYRPYTANTITARVTYFW